MITKLQKNKRIAKWKDWHAREYLDAYFTRLGPDSVETIKYLTSKFSEIKSGGEKNVLDFGAGPTAFLSLVVAPYCDEIHLADYLPSNLNEIKKWHNSKIDSFNWEPCCREILKLQGIDPNPKNVKVRMDEARSKTKKILVCNADLQFPILSRSSKYQIVTSIFCPESATSSKAKWVKYMTNISSLVKRDGLIILSGLRNCKFYKVGDRFFPSANINETDLRISLEKCRFLLTEPIKVIKVPECTNEGFSSIMLASAKQSY